MTRRLTKEKTKFHADIEQFQELQVEEAKESHSETSSSRMTDESFSEQLERSKELNIQDEINESRNSSS